MKDLPKTVKEGLEDLLEHKDYDSQKVASALIRRYLDMGYDMSKYYKTIKVPE